MNPVAAVRRLGGRTPLRVSLVVALVALLTLGLVLAGAASTAMLSGYLVRQIDDRLIEVSRGFADAPRRSARARRPPAAAVRWRATPSDLYVAYLDAAGSVVGELSNPYGVESTVSCAPRLDARGGAGPGHGSLLRGVRPGR